MTQKEFVGPGSIVCLKEILAELGSKRIFLVTGKRSYSACGAEACLQELLEDYEVHRFCQFTVNPKVDDIDRGIDAFRATGCDTVIAVGGGSTIDMAKAINYLAVQPLTLGGYEIGVKASEATIKPLVAIPTTSGSGSEATHFAVVYVGRQKHSIYDERMLPRIAIVDANLTMSLPKYTTAVSGLDALGQAVESYWSIHSTNDSKQFASAAIELITANLLAVVKNPGTDSRGRMAEAAHLAGKAINLTKTTAAHSISYPLTSYFGIPHGQAVGVTLPSLLVFNANVTDKDVLDKRGARYVRETIDEICKLLGASSVSDARERIDSIIREIGLETRLSLLGLLNREDIETIVANGCDPDRVKNNPRMLTKETLRGILEEIY
ncbi:MAG: phosphonoacetaldehyde reductase [Planctomycetota bacterium]